MPMYYPDLKSIKAVAKTMATYQKPENLYKGIIPENEAELLEARKQLGQYFREIWKDEIQALEVELALTEENYHREIRKHMVLQAILNLT